MKKIILFQGDSITDAGRNRTDFYAMGNGYANFVKGALGLDRPGAYEFLNRGIGGNRIVDLYARIKQDLINLKPDYASIYIGVNDAYAEMVRQNGVDTVKFEKIYSLLLDEVLEACPHIRLMILAPYVLEGLLTCNTEDDPCRYTKLRWDVEEKAAAAKRIAEKYGLPLVELQPAFDDACKTAPPQYWTYDGVHPTACGHELIKRLWLKAFHTIA